MRAPAWYTEDKVNNLSNQLEVLMEGFHLQKCKADIKFLKEEWGKARISKCMEACKRMDNTLTKVLLRKHFLISMGSHILIRQHERRSMEARECNSNTRIRTLRWLMRRRTCPISRSTAREDSTCSNMPSRCGTNGC